MWFVIVLSDCPSVTVTGTHHGDDSRQGVRRGSTRCQTCHLYPQVRVKVVLHVTETEVTLSYF